MTISDLSLGSAASAAALQAPTVVEGVPAASGVPSHVLALLGVLLFFGLLLPRLLRPLHLPFSTSLILVGSLMGPYGFGVVAPDESLALFGLLGAMFHMLLAGTEARHLEFRGTGPETLRLGLPNAIVPFAAGVAIARGFGYDWTSALFLGTIFLSSSIMLVFGLVASLGLEHTKRADLLRRTAVMHDLAASTIVFLLFHTLDPHPRFPLAILAGLLLSSIVILRMFLPEVVSFFFTRFEERGGDDHEARLRLVISLFLIVIFLYSALDVHPVIAAFLVGLALADVPTAPMLRERFETMGYGLFIPVFLFAVGLETDLGVILGLHPGDVFAASVLAGAVASKVASGYLGARWAGIGSHDAWFVGVASTVKLAVPLTATYAARDLGLLDARLFSAIVVVSVVTSVIAPLIVAVITRRPFERIDA